MDTLREKIAEIFSDAFESGANGGGGSFAEEEYTNRILALPEIKEALAGADLAYRRGLRDERDEWRP